MLFSKLVAASALSLALATPALANDHVVIVTGFSYFPAVTFAEPGDTVRFLNQSGGPETIVGRDTGWVIGPLNDQEEGELVVTEETELAFFSAYMDCTEGSATQDAGCSTSRDAPTTTGDAASSAAPQNPYGNFEDAVIKAEISFDHPALEADQSDEED